MTIEQKVNIGGRSLRHPFGRSTWVPVEIPEGETPEIKLNNGGVVVLNRLVGMELLKYEDPENPTKSKIVVGQEINKLKAPWSGQIRRRN